LGVEKTTLQMVSAQERIGLERRRPFAAKDFEGLRRATNKALR
jgi:hypothetical protein